MVFGGYATDSWSPDGKRFGTPKSFLFSVSLDRKIPFHGRQRDHLTQVQWTLCTLHYTLYSHTVLTHSTHTLYSPTLYASPHVDAAPGGS
jgi:hypothetical protein